MKRITGNGRPKSKKKAATRNLASASIAKRYMELRRLRKQLSEAESRRNDR